MLVYPTSRQCCASSKLKMENSDYDEDFIVVASATILLLTVMLKKKRKARSIWVNSYLRKRNQKGRFVNDVSQFIVPMCSYKVVTIWF